MMRTDSEFEQSYESVDLQYHLILGYKIEVEERR